MTLDQVHEQTYENTKEANEAKRVLNRKCQVLKNGKFVPQTWQSFETQTATDFDAKDK